jgi:integrase
MGLTQRTISYNRGILQQVFDRLVRHKIVSANPVLAIDVAGAGRPSAILLAYTSEQLAEISALVYTTENELAHAFALTLHGLRLSEVMGLRFRDISTDGKVTISRSRIHVDASVSGIGEPKSARSAREVKLDPRAWALLKAERRRRRAMDDFVVADAAGRPMRPETYSDRWKKFISKTDLPVYDLRIVRRSVETSMRDHGVPVHVTAAVMGHSEAMSIRHYTTAHQARMDDAMDTLIKSLGGAS